MCCRHSRIAANGTQTRNIGTSREERTNSSLPSKKTQTEKNSVKTIRIQNTERRVRRQRSKQKSVLQQTESPQHAGEEGLARLIASHQKMRESAQQP